MEAHSPGFLFFHSLPFLQFFAIVFAIYWVIPWHRPRMAWLLAASCFFYMSWNWKLIGLILFSAGIDFLVALWLEKLQSARARKTLMILSVTTNLGLLAFFKYVNFFLTTVSATMTWFGGSARFGAMDIVLPLGISFYTFETISYIVDVYKGRTKAERNFLDYSLFIMFFPHLIAGPIVRPSDFLPQIKLRKRWNWDRMQFGLQYFLVGLIKKAVIADHLAVVADDVFKAPGTFSSASVWLGALAYAGQIYCDFSGYTDMAIGIAHLFGFRLRKNFNLPYASASITEFWQRWHISLSSWLRDYLYIPLGGNRNGALQTYRNLMATMLLGGLWHGANWTFLVWGGYHGGLLATERAWPGLRSLSRGWLRPVGVLMTFLLVTVGWVFFRAQTLTDAGVVLSRMFWLAPGAEVNSAPAGIAWSCLGVVLFFHLIRLSVDLRKWERLMPFPVMGGALATLLMAALTFMPKARVGFLYFQF